MTGHVSVGPSKVTGEGNTRGVPLGVVGELEHHLRNSDSVRQGARAESDVAVGWVCHVRHVWFPSVDTVPTRRELDVGLQAVWAGNVKVEVFPADRVGSRRVGGTGKLHEERIRRLPHRVTD